ncbi:MAG: right-handed parallel beta-helix repeat-containing protein [Verrucomicrobiota bacterium]
MTHQKPLPGWKALSAALTIASTLPASADELPAYADPDYSNRFTKGSLAPILPPALALHVSVSTGDDANDGSEANPLKSLEAARDLVRKRIAAGLPDGGIEVRIHPGEYHFTETLRFAKEDSGTVTSPIVWRGHEPGKVVFTGGNPLDASQFETIKAPAILERLHPDARGKVIGIDLSTLQPERVFGGKGKYGMLSMDGHLLQLAQWPNRGYHHIGEIIDKGPTTRWLKPGEKPAPFSVDNPTGGKFRFKETLSPQITAEFARSGDMRAEGYFHNDWYFQNETVGNIEGEVVQLLHHTRYGIENKIKTLPRRVRLVNVLAELDQPGEWYYDRQLKGLYVWPIPGFDPQKSTVTVPSGPQLIELRDTRFLTFRDFVFENTGELAMAITGGSHNLLAASTVRNGVRRGVTINGGKHNGITGCEFHDLFSAFSISGGDFKKLERCYNFATNNRIHSCRNRGYGLIGLSGVGLRFAHNLLHDMNGAVAYKTTDLLMEYNEFYNIGYEMGDFNVAYCGAQWWSMGNVLRFNFVHHLFEPGGHPVCPFRNDDGGAGLQMFGNVFYRTGRCAGQFAGPANSLRNNIAIDMPLFWWTNKRTIDEAGIKARWEALSIFGTDLPKGDKGDYLYILEKKIGEKAWLKSPWKDEYPELAEFIRINPWAQTLGNVTHNYMHKIRNPFHIHGGDGTVEGMESKRTGRFRDLPKEGEFVYPEEISLSAFTDPKSLDFSFKPSFKPMEGFAPIPFGEIGLRKSPFREDPPDKTAYRRSIYEQFKDDRARGYDPKVVNSRYPTPAYLEN